MDYNRIDSVSTRVLALGIQHNKTLKVLQLSYNNIGDVGCQYLAEALYTNTALQVLALRRNGITDGRSDDVGGGGIRSMGTGAKALENVLLRSNCTLHRIDLQENDGIGTCMKKRVEILCRANQVGRGRLLMIHGNNNVDNVAVQPLPQPPQFTTMDIDNIDAATMPPPLLPQSPFDTLLLWPKVLEIINHEPDMLYFFLRSKPDICQPPLPPPAFRLPSVEEITMEEEMNEFTNSNKIDSMILS